jgi:hypothetical protein
MACDCDASSCDGNHVVRDQMFLPAGTSNCESVDRARTLPRTTY